MANIEFKKRVLFIGVPDMAFIGMDTLLYAGVNIVGVIGPLKTHGTYSLFKEFSLSRNQNFIEYETLDSPELIKTINDLNVDIAVVCSFNNKIPKAFIDAIKDGILNIHPSLLPKYRGGNPYSHAIFNGEKETGVSIHYISENFDEGDIVAQEKLPVQKNETMGTLFHKTNQIGCRMLLQCLLYYEKNGSLPRQPQPDGDFVKAPNLKDSELLIDYNQSADCIERFVRGVNPYMSMQTVYKNQTIKFHKVSVFNKNYKNFDPGQICDIKQGKIYIKTSDGCIIPEVIQFAGLFIGNCEDFINIVNPKIGDKFTNEYT